LGRVPQKKRKRRCTAGCGGRQKKKPVWAELPGQRPGLRAGRGGAAHADDSQQGRISPRRPEFHMRTGGGG